jgi:hypothetical protein
VPVSFSYDPVAPKGCPFATADRLAIVTLVTSANTGAEHHKMQSAAATVFIFWDLASTGGLKASGYNYQLPTTNQPPTTNHQPPTTSYAC